MAWTEPRDPLSMSTPEAELELQYEIELFARLLTIERPEGSKA